MPLLTGTGKPRVILGLMTFGPDSNTGARITSLDEYNKCLDYFQSRGYDEIDTARMYIGGLDDPFVAQSKLIIVQVNKKHSQQTHIGKNGV